MDDETRDLLVANGRHVLALEACLAALIDERLGGTVDGERAATILSLVRSARRYIEQVDLAGDGSPRPGHDLAKRVAAEKAEALISRLA